LVFQIASAVAEAENPPNYVEVPAPSGGNARFRVYLGTIPDYANSNITGVLLSGVKAESPAALAGLRAGDVIIELAETAVGNIYDYTYILSGLRPAEAVKIKVLRDGKELTLSITPAART